MIILKNQHHAIVLSQYIVAFFIILDCRSLYGRLTNTPSWWEYFIYLGLILGIGVAFIGNGIHINTKKMHQLSLLVFFLVYMFIYVMVHRFSFASINLSVKIILLCIYCILYDDFSNIPNLLTKYKDLIFIIAIFSVFFWLFGSILHIIPQFGYVYSKWTGTFIAVKVPNYYYIYFETQTSNMAALHLGELPRNSAIFTEGPMASFHFSLAFLIEYYLMPQKSYRKLVVLVVAIITTLSITGFIVLAAVLCLKILTKKSPNSTIQILKFPFIIGGVILIGSVVYYLVSNKFNSNSGNIRLDDFRVCVKAWLLNPLFGNDIGNFTAIRAFMGNWRNFNTGLSTSLGQILSDGGLYLSLVYIVAFVCSIAKSTAIKDKNRLIFSIIFLGIFTITIVSYNFISLLIIAWMLLYDKNKPADMKKMFYDYCNSMKLML